MPCCVPHLRMAGGIESFGWGLPAYEIWDTTDYHNPLIDDGLQNFKYAQLTQWSSTFGVKNGIDVNFFRRGRGVPMCMVRLGD